MESEGSDKSFGSEPDFSKMSPLRINIEAMVSGGGVGGDGGGGEDGVGHVFDELGDDTPRGFSHEVQEADTSRLQAMLDAFEDGVYGDGDGDAILGEDGDGRTGFVDGAASGDGGGEVFLGFGIGTVEDGAPRRARSPVKPQRMHADRQTTRPLHEQVEEWRRTIPHIRVRGRSALLPPATAAAILDPTALEGVQLVRGPLHLEDVTDEKESPAGGVGGGAPWLTAMESAAGEWWGRVEDAPELIVTGRAFGSRRAPPSPLPQTPPGADASGDEEETFAADGDIEEVYAADTPDNLANYHRTGALHLNSGSSGGSDGGDGGGGGGGGSGNDSSSDTGADSARAVGAGAAVTSAGLAAILDARRASRRHAAGFPSLDPLEVIALDGAFDRGEVVAGEVEPKPPGGESQVITFDDNRDEMDDVDCADSDGHELSIAGEQDSAVGEGRYQESYYEGEGDGDGDRYVGSEMGSSEIESAGGGMMRGVLAAPGMSQGDERGEAYTMRRLGSSGGSRGSRGRFGGVGGVHSGFPGFPDSPGVFGGADGDGDDGESAYEYGGEGFAEEYAYEYTRGEERYVDGDVASGSDGEGAGAGHGGVPGSNPGRSVSGGGGGGGDGGGNDDGGGGGRARAGQGHDLGGAGMFFTGGTIADSTTGETGKWGSHEEVEEQGVVWFEADAEGNVSPNPWPGEVRWGGAAHGAQVQGQSQSQSAHNQSLSPPGAGNGSESEWSDADSEERGYWGTGNPAPAPVLADWLVSNNQTSLEEMAAKDTGAEGGGGGSGSGDAVYNEDDFGGGVGSVGSGTQPELTTEMGMGGSPDAITHGEGGGEAGPRGSAIQWGWGDGPGVGSGSIAPTPTLLSPDMSAFGASSPDMLSSLDHAAMARDEASTPVTNMFPPSHARRQRSSGGAAVLTGAAPSARAVGGAGGELGRGSHRDNTTGQTRGFSGRVQIPKPPIPHQASSNQPPTGTTITTRRRRMVTKPPVPTSGQAAGARPPFRAGKAAPPPRRVESPASAHRHLSMAADNSADNLGMGISGTGMTAGVRGSAATASHTNAAHKVLGGGKVSGAAGGSRVAATHVPPPQRHHPRG